MGRTRTPTCKGFACGLVASAAVASSAANAHVLLDEPNGGELLMANTVFPIEWHVDIQHNTIGWDLEYSTDGGGSWQVIALGLPPGDVTEGAAHSYAWTVPNDPSDRVRVRVKQDNTGQDYYDTSDADLTLVGPACAVPLPAVVLSSGLGLWRGRPRSQREGAERPVRRPAASPR